MTDAEALNCKKRPTYRGLATNTKKVLPEIEWVI